MRIRWRFVACATLLGSVTALLVTSVLLLGQMNRSLPPLPPPPTIRAPRGTLPAQNVALREILITAQGETWVGSGFLLRTASDTVYLVTTAHSLGTTPPPQAQLALRTADGRTIAQIPLSAARIGRPRSTDDLRVDYVIAPLDAVTEPAWVLRPDPRPWPLPGERVVLHTGTRAPVPATVRQVEARAIWLETDIWFPPGLSSGGPVLSEHTGGVLGMAIAARFVGTHLLIGLHPTASLLQHLEQAP